ncbi:MerR family DNA-binding transcriptional regulator [Lysinibacillus endophyticus]
MYTVHEVAKLAHTTVKTLHHYHKIGLLIPEQTTEAGYRLYGKKI